MRYLQALFFAITILQDYSIATQVQEEACTDLTPDTNTCGQHLGWNNCQNLVQSGFCKRTCGACSHPSISTSTPPPRPVPNPDPSTLSLTNKKYQPFETAKSQPPAPKPVDASSSAAVTGSSFLSEYAKVLGLSYKFYDAQRSGVLPKSVTARVPWRGNSHTSDKVVGGYYDAGDFLKLYFPLANSLSFLAYGLLEFPGSYAYSAQTLKARSALKWGARFLIRSHPSPNKIIGQIGAPSIDHAYWGRPEQQTGARPFYVWDSSKPASDLSAAFSAALASTSLVFKSSDPEFSAKCLLHAKQLFDFASTKLGKYSDQYPSATYVYTSSGYLDDLAYSAAWLCRATGDTSYCTKSKNYRVQSGFNPNSFVSWDSVSLLSAILLKGMGQAPLEAQQQIQRFTDDWTKNFSRTPGGLVLAPLGGWGNLRYTTSAAMAALISAKYETDAAKRSNAICWAKSQLDYALGLRGGRSFVVGYGKNPPTQPHHRSSSCPDLPAPCTWDNFNYAGPNPQVLSGALVGGPRGPTDSYTDVRSDYVSNEVAFDYNAGFTSALAGLIHFTRS